MKFFTALLLISTSFSIVSYGQSQKRPTLLEVQQKVFLSQRLKGGGGINGSFAAYGSLLYAMLDVAIHTDDKEIGATVLHSSFPEFYEPTWKELFDAIAVQTHASWKYDATRDYWVFTKTNPVKPFTILPANQWSSADRGLYVGYKPPNFPVGMDIYYYGFYSSDKVNEQSALWEKVRNAWATSFASNFKKDIIISQMQKVKVADAEALYFQTPAPKNNVIWRQWAFVKDGYAFVIVSTLRPEDKELLSDVEAMVKSFRVAP